jgi:hypothetical protein
VAREPDAARERVRAQDDGAHDRDADDRVTDTADHAEALTRRRATRCGTKLFRESGRRH